MTKIILGFILGLLLTANFAASAQQNKKVADARKELLKAKADSVADAQKFISEAKIKISKNQQKINALKAKNATENKEVNAKYQERLSAIEQQNNELKNRIEGYDTNTSMWASFKQKFNYDMKELVRVIEDND